MTQRYQLGLSRFVITNVHHGHGIGRDGAQKAMLSLLAHGTVKPPTILQMQLGVVMKCSQRQERTHVSCRALIMQHVLALALKALRAVSGEEQSSPFARVNDEPSIHVSTGPR